MRDSRDETTESDDGQSVFSGIVSVFFGDFGRVITFAVFIPILVRTIGETGYGTYALVMAVFAPMRVATNAGLFDATKTYLSRAETDDERDVIASTSLTLHALLTLAGGGVLVGIALFAPLSEAAADSLLVVIVALTGEQAFKFGRAVLHAHRHEASVEPLILVRSVLLAVVGIALAAGTLQVVGVFVGFGVGFMIAGIGASWQAFRRQPISPLSNIEWAWADRLLRFGAPSMALMLLITGLYKVDVILVNQLLNETAAGHYRAALQIAEFIWMLSIGVQFVMIQSTADLWAKGDTDRIQRLVGRLVRYVVVLTVLGIIGIGTLADEFVRLYFGPAFEPAITPLLVLLPGVIGFAVARVIWPVLQAGGFLRPLLAVTGVAFGLNLVGNLLLIPRVGIGGAAFATSLSYGLLGVGQIGVARRAGIRPLADLPIGALLLVGGATAAVTVGVDAVVPGVWALLAVPPAGLITFGALLILTGIVTRTELVDLYTRHLGHRFG
jgi:O-antigen/teichoic acid export membrane protein